MNLSIRPEIIRRTKVLLSNSQTVSIWGLENSPIEVDKIWNRLKDTLATNGKEMLDAKDVRLDSRIFCTNICMEPHYNVLFSGGWDSTALILNHLEKGEKVIPFYISFYEPTKIMAEISVKILQKIYGTDLIADLKPLFGDIVCNGTEEHTLAQQSFSAFFASKIGRTYTENAIATEIAYCMNDDAISYLDDLRNLYKSGVNCCYPPTKAIPLKFPLKKQKHLDNVKTVINCMNKRDFFLPVTCLDSVDFTFDAFEDKDGNDWISFNSNLEKADINKDNKLSSEFYTGIFIKLTGHYKRELPLSERIRKLRAYQKSRSDEDKEIKIDC